MNTTEESKERILSNHFFSVKNLTMDGMWVVLLFISGLFKIPSPIPGTEFQLSAPLANKHRKNQRISTLSYHRHHCQHYWDDIRSSDYIQCHYRNGVPYCSRSYLNSIKKGPTGPHYCWSCRNVCSQTGIGNNLGCCLATFSSKRSSWNDFYCNNCPCSDFNSKKSP